MVRFVVKKSYIFISLIAFFLLSCVMLYREFYGKYHEMKKEVVKLSKSKVKLEEICFGRIWVTYRYDAKGLIIVYHLGDNGWYSVAYWIPFGSEKIMLLK